MLSSRPFPNVPPDQGVLNIGPEELALRIAEVIDERQGTEVAILDVTGPLVIADYFVVATVRNDRHGAALARELIATLKAGGHLRRNAAGLDSETGWVLLDFDEVVVHLFTEEAREFYDLENLWSDAPRVAFTPSAPKSPSDGEIRQAIFPDSMSSASDSSGPMGTR